MAKSILFKKPVGNVNYTPCQDYINKDFFKVFYYNKDLV